MDSASALLELQKADLAIYRDQAKLKKMPEAAQIVDVRSRLRELARRSLKLKGMIKDQEMTLQDLQEERSNLERQVNQITQENKTASFRQVKNNNAILDGLAKKLEKNEYLANKAEAEMNNLREAHEKSVQVKTSLEQRERDLLVSLRKNAEPLRDELTRLSGERESHMASLSQSTLKAYEDSCKAHGGVGVGELQGSVCSGCGMQLQPSQLDALRGGPNVQTCPVCGRMLVVRTTE